MSSAGCMRHAPVPSQLRRAVDRDADAGHQHDDEEREANEQSERT